MYHLDGLTPHITILGVSVWLASSLGNASRMPIPRTGSSDEEPHFPRSRSWVSWCPCLLNDISNKATEWDKIFAQHTSDKGLKPTGALKTQQTTRKLKDGPEILTETSPKNADYKEDTQIENAG